MYPYLAESRLSDKSGHPPIDIDGDTDMKFEANVGPIDRVVRIVLGIGLAAVALAGVAAPWLYVVWVVAALALVTGMVGFCPLYAVLHVSTKRAAH